MNLSNAVRTAKSIITANSPVLLVGTAVAGVVATGVLAAKGGYAARAIIDEAEEEKGAELTPTEKVQLTWLCYAAPVLTGASAIAASVAVHTIHTKRHAALAGLYAVASTKMDDYKDKAEELLGAKKSQQLNDAVAQAAIDRAGPIENHEIIMVDKGTDLCYDEWGARWFMGSVPIIERAFIEINRTLMEDGDASLNDFYDHVGLEPNMAGKSMGWSGGRVEPRFGSTRSPDGRPAISFWFHRDPKVM